MSMDYWVLLAGLASISVGTGMLGKKVYLGKTKANPVGVKAHPIGMSPLGLLGIGAVLIALSFFAE